VRDVGGAGSTPTILRSAVPDLTQRDTSAHSLSCGNVGLIDAATLDRLPEPLRPRLADLLANPDG
ncbi:MAG: hypothetical protein O3A18_14160, partial [Planctomycetota bacterium]|nr:hypothetical protein [Planctomycetota bacterium]